MKSKGFGLSSVIVVALAACGVSVGCGSSSGADARGADATGSAGGPGVGGDDAGPCSGPLCDAEMTAADDDTMQPALPGLTVSGPCSGADCEMAADDDTAMTGNDMAMSDDAGVDAGAETTEADGGTPTASTPAHTTSGPPFPGAGTGYEPLVAGCGPDTADECTGTCEGEGGDPDVIVEREPATLCFSEDGATEPAVVIEQVVETVGDQEYVHIRITFNPDFVDNTYGENSIGWDNRKNGHTWKDLVGSDHAVILLTNSAGDTVMELSLDYISEDPNAPCGFSSGGVTAGEGEVLQGDPAYVLAATTSANRNINYCGFDDCYVDNSPATDESWDPNADTPQWDYRVVYEVWIAVEAFGDEGFGQAFMTEVHASPSKTDSHTVEVMPSDCTPPDDNEPPPGECPVNYTLLASEGKECCVPIPFAGYEGMLPCPTGFALDLASEGRYCVPEDGSDGAQCTPTGS